MRDAMPAFRPERNSIRHHQRIQEVKGDRSANSAFWHIVLTRMGVRPPNPALPRATNEGEETKKEAMRCLKRYVAREVFKQLPVQVAT
jgi:hypothetical protein